MTDLNALIRIRKHSVEQKQKFLAELYRQAEELENQKKTLKDQMAKEREKVKDMGVEMLAYFGPYANAVKDRIGDIDDSLRRLESRIKMAQDDMREAFSEMKKIELIQAQREIEEAEALKKKESDLLDEIGIEAYRRGLKDEGGN